MPAFSDNTRFAPFPPTQWSMVVEAAGGATEESRRAIEEICKTYWVPLYAFIRRSGFGKQDAEDLTQDFLAKLLERDTLATVAAEKGKLRTFLLVVLKNFLKDHRKRESALKRGGGKVVSFDQEIAENHYHSALTDDVTPDAIFAKSWAQTILDSVFDELAEEHEASGKGEQFDILCSFLQRNSREGKYADVATRLGTTEGAVKVAVYRLRKRYRAVFHARVLETVADESELDEEIAFFFTTFEG